MNRFLSPITFLVLVSVAVTQLFATPEIPKDQMQPNLLWYRAPAQKWIEALPVGNGRLGAMVFGGTESERLALNDITVWSGGPQLDANRTDGFAHREEIRDAIRDGDYPNAEKLCVQFLSCKVNYNDNQYQALGDLQFTFQLPQGEVNDYRRWLDIDSAIAGVEYQSGRYNIPARGFL